MVSDQRSECYAGGELSFPREGFLIVFHDVSSLVRINVKLTELAPFRERFAKPNFRHIVVLNARPVRIVVLVAESLTGFLVAFAHLAESEPATRGESWIGHSVVCAEKGVNFDLVFSFIIPASVRYQFLDSCASPIDGEGHSDVRGKARDESDG